MRSFYFDNILVATIDTSNFGDKSPSFCVPDFFKHVLTELLTIDVARAADMQDAPDIMAERRKAVSN